MRWISWYKKQLNEALKKKKKFSKEELRALEKMSVLDYVQESSDSSSNKEVEIWKLGTVKLFNLNNNRSRKKLK